MYIYEISKHDEWKKMDEFRERIWNPCKNYYTSSFVEQTNIRKYIDLFSLRKTILKTTFIFFFTDAFYVAGHKYVSEYVCPRDKVFWFTIFAVGMWKQI